MWKPPTKSGIAACDGVSDPAADDGSFADSVHDNALIVLALAESYAMSGVKDWAEPLQNAVRYIESIQNVEGGWPAERAYDPSDVLVTGWNILALKSTRVAGINVDVEKFTKAKTWIISQTNTATGIVYEGRSELATAVGMVIRIMTGQKPTEEMNVKGAQILMQAAPELWDDFEFFYWSGLASFHIGSTAWISWTKHATQFATDRCRIRTVCCRAHCKVIFMVVMKRSLGDSAKEERCGAHDPIPSGTNSAYRATFC